jgi:RimJ/RimL family protein N-acetyltransferase
MRGLLGELLVPKLDSMESKGSNDVRFEFFEAGGAPEPTFNVIPRDDLHAKRSENLRKARKILVMYHDSKIVGLVFLNRKLHIFSMLTWIVSKEFQSKGFGTIMTKRFIQDVDTRPLFAYCRNIKSIKLAERTGFTVVGSFAYRIRR